MIGRFCQELGVAGVDVKPGVEVGFNSTVGEAGEVKLASGVGDAWVGVMAVSTGISVVEEGLQAARVNSRKQPLITAVFMESSCCLPGFIPCLFNRFHHCSYMLRCVSTAAAHNACSQRNIFNCKFTHLLRGHIEDCFPVHQAG